MLARGHAVVVGARPDNRGVWGRGSIPFGFSGHLTEGLQVSKEILGLGDQVRNCTVEATKHGGQTSEISRRLRDRAKDV